MSNPSKEPPYQDWPTENVVSFSSPDSAYGFLSNRAPGFPITINGIQYLTAEALFQVCHFPDHPDLQSRIIADQNHKRVSRYAAIHFDKVRPDWPYLRLEAMRWVVRRKFSQYERLAELLQSTGQRPIIFQSFDDIFWGARYANFGTGTYGDQPVFRGRNTLGCLLMELRQQLRENGWKSFQEKQDQPTEILLPTNLPTHQKPVSLYLSSRPTNETSGKCAPIN